MIAGHSPAGLRVWKGRTELYNGEPDPQGGKEYHVFPEWNADAFLVQPEALCAAGEGWTLDTIEHEPYTFDPRIQNDKEHPENMDQGLTEWYFKGPKPDVEQGHTLLRRAFEDLKARDPSLKFSPCGFGMFIGKLPVRRGVPRRRKVRHQHRVVRQRRQWAHKWGLTMADDYTSVTYTPPEVTAAVERVQRLMPSWVQIRGHCYGDETALRAAARFVFEVRCADSQRLVFRSEDAAGTGRHRMEMHPSSCWVDCTPRSMGGGFITNTMRFCYHDMPRRVVASLRRAGEGQAAVLVAGWETATQKIHMFDEGDNVCYRVGYDYSDIYWQDSD